MLLALEQALTAAFRNQILTLGLPFIPIFLLVLQAVRGQKGKPGAICR